MAYAADYATGYAGNYNVAKKVLDQEITMCRYIDTSTATGTNLTSGSYYKIFTVPALFLLTSCKITVVTAEGATGTIDVVDDDSATTTFVNDADLNGAAGTVTNTNARKLYTAAGFICLLPNNDLDTAKFYVEVRGILLNTSM